MAYLGWYGGFCTAGWKGLLQPCGDEGIIEWTDDLAVPVVPLLIAAIGNWKMFKILLWTNILFGCFGGVSKNAECGDILHLHVKVWNEVWTSFFIFLSLPIMIGPLTASDFGAKFGIPSANIASMIPPVGGAMFFRVYMEFWITAPLQM